MFSHVICVICRAMESEALRYGRKSFTFYGDSQGSC